jgi:hypothetical protein
MRQITIFDLPAEVLGEILTQCDNPAILETCKTFATVAFSTTSLWTTVYICPHQLTADGPDFLRKRISRARGRLLDVVMWLPDEDAAEVSALPVCTALSEFNTQIRSFKLTAPQTMISGAVVHYVFPKSDAMPALEVLSVLSAQGIANITEFLTPEQLLRLALVNASTMFPNLRKLHMNTYHDALPMTSLLCLLCSPDHAHPRWIELERVQFFPRRAHRGASPLHTAVGVVMG